MEIVYLKFFLYYKLSRCETVCGGWRGQPVEMYILFWEVEERKIWSACSNSIRIYDIGCDATWTLWYSCGIYTLHRYRYLSSPSPPPLSRYTLHPGPPLYPPLQRDPHFRIGFEPSREYPLLVPRICQIHRSKNSPTFFIVFCAPKYFLPCHLFHTLYTFILSLCGYLTGSLSCGFSPFSFFSLLLLLIIESGGWSHIGVLRGCFTGGSVWTCMGHLVNLCPGGR